MCGSKARLLGAPYWVLISAAGDSKLWKSLSVSTCSIDLVLLSLFCFLFSCRIMGKSKTEAKNLNTFNDNELFQKGMMGQGIGPDSRVRTKHTCCCENRCEDYTYFTHHGPFFFPFPAPFFPGTFFTGAGGGGAGAGAGARAAGGAGPGAGTYNTPGTAMCTKAAFPNRALGTGLATFPETPGAG